MRHLEDLLVSTLVGGSLAFGLAIAADAAGTLDRAPDRSAGVPLSATSGRVNRFVATSTAGLSYAIVDTGLKECFGDRQNPIPCPGPDDPFHGQDAQHDGLQPGYLDNSDGSVTDWSTGLIWQKTPDFNKRTWAQSVDYCDELSLADNEDWRLPSIKQLYSLINFNGNSRAANPIPYIDTDFFDFQWGDTGSGDRLIDAQYWSRTGYAGTTMNGAPTAFGVNFADGRIKGYPTDRGPGGSPFARYSRCVLDEWRYGINRLVDNGNGTISDKATGLQWMKADSGTALNWEGALAYAANLEHAEFDDWRLPNAKELHSIVDYTRAPDAANPVRTGPAIDPRFDVTETESWFWSSTTHLEGPGRAAAAYFAFGQAFGYMTGPTGQKTKMNVHGAGAQRSDPKSGDPADYEGGLGPQGDEIRIYNYARAVRDAPELAPTPTPTTTDVPVETPSTSTSTPTPSGASATPTVTPSGPTVTPSATATTDLLLTRTPTPALESSIYLPIAFQP